MNELTDLQICQRIAEIEGEEVTIRYEWDKNLRTRLSYGVEFYDRMPEYNPLTDDALCLKFIVKHELSIINIGEDLFMVQCKMITVDTSDSVNINKAICLAIIKSKE
jgi:hypothetical protein